MTTETLKPATPPPASPTPSKRRKLLLILALVVIICAVAWSLYYFTYARWHQDTDDAYVQGNIVSIVPQTIGTVISIDADDGMKVIAGQPLVHLDQNDAQVAYDQAIANLASTVRQVRGLYNNVESGQADIRARQVAVEQARADLKRREGLVAAGAVSKEELAHARSLLASAESALSASQGQLERSRALVDATTVKEQPQVSAASAQVREAYLNLQRGVIVAPVTGHVARRSVQLGQRVQPGTPLMTIVPLDQVWVEANFKETQLDHMRIGQPVELTSDLYGKSVKYEGKISSLGIGTGSAFSILPAQNASGNWIKIVQRVPVRIDIDNKQLQQHPLRIGLSMRVDVGVKDQSGAVLSEAVTNNTSKLMTTQAYSKQLSDVDSIIDGIISNNLPAARRKNS